MSSREAVLGRIRSALAADVTAPPPVPRDYIRVGANPPGSEPVLELMVDRLVDYKAQVREVSPAELADAIDTALADQASVVVAPDLDAALAEATGRSGRTVTSDGDPSVLTPAELDGIDAVMSTARVAIALSGTIILDGGPGQGRRAITLVCGGRWLLPGESHGCARWGATDHGVLVGSQRHRNPLGLACSRDAVVVLRPHGIADCVVAAASKVDGQREAAGEPDAESPSSTDAARGIRARSVGSAGA